MRTYRLRDVCAISMGQAPAGESYNEDRRGWPLIAGAGDFGELHPAPKKYTTEATRLSAHGDIVIGVRATIGEKVIANGEYCLGRGVAGLRPGPKLDHRFLWHWLSYVGPTLASKARGATFKQVNKEDIGELKLKLLPMVDQNRIATILDHADVLRVKRGEALAQLDRLIRAVFIDMFGDPVTGPKQCSEKTLGDCVEKLQYGPRFYNEAYSADGIRIVRITDLDRSGVLDFNAMPRMEVDQETRNQFCLRPGDIVFARTGATVGKVALIRKHDPVCIAGAYFIRLRFKDSVLPGYALHVLRAKSVQKIIATQSRQAAQQNFSGPGLRSLPMPIPSLERQRVFLAVLEKIESERETAQKSLAAMYALFSSLQHRAFHGEL